MDQVQSMRSVIDVHAAKTQFSRLLGRAEAGEEIIISRRGEPVARLVPLAGPRPKRKLGILAGRVHIAADFDAPLPEALLAAFEGPIGPPHRPRKRRK